MKVVFTASKHPQLGSQAISAFERSKWTHVVIMTDVNLPTGEPIVMHSSWHQGVTLAPASVAIGDKMTKVYEDQGHFDWGLALSFLHEYQGFMRYGWAHVIGAVLRAFYIPEPKWLVSRYEGQLHCSGFIVKKNQARGLMKGLDPHKTGPGVLQNYMDRHAQYKETTLI